MTVFVLTSLVLWASVVWASVVLASDYTSYREEDQFFRTLLRNVHDRDDVITAKRQTSETLSDWLTEMHMMIELMHQLHNPDRKQLVDLMHAVQHDQLTQYMQKIGYRAIFVILSHVSRPQSLDLEHLLEKHLRKEAAIAKAIAANAKPTAQPATRTTLTLTTITMKPSKTTTQPINTPR